MKKLFAILCTLACLAMLCIPAMAAFDTVESLAVVGTGIPGVGEWKTDDPAGDMTEVSDGIWEKTLDLTAGTFMKFKVAGNDTWDDSCNFGSATIVLGEKADLECSGGSGDMPFTAEKDMTIKITVDITGDVATILVTEVTGDEPVAPPVEDPTEPSEDPTEPSEDSTEPSEEPTEPSDEPTTEAPSAEDESKADEETTKPTTAKKETMTPEQRRAKRTTVYIVLGISLLVIIGIACILSIPKKIR